MTGLLKVLIVSNFFDTHRGGLEIVAGHLARELARLGLDVTWLATDATATSRQVLDAPVRCVAVSAWNWAERSLGVPYPLIGPAGLRSLAREIGRADVVLLHDSLYMISVATFWASRRRRKPLLLLQHIGHVPYRNSALSWLMAAANRCVARPLLARADQVVFISETVREFFRSTRFRRPPTVIFNGVDAEIFRPTRQGEREACRQRFGLSQDRPVAVFAGRFVEKKGLHWLHRAALARPGVDWVFAGWGVMDPRSWGLKNVIVIDDAQPSDVADLNRAGDVFVLPSQGEGFPLVVQEALACGLPVVCGVESTRADAAAQRFLYGVEIDSRQPERTMAGLLEAVDMALAAGSAKAAEDRAVFARKRYTWSSAAQGYADVLAELIGSGSTRSMLRSA